MLTLVRALLHNKVLSEVLWGSHLRTMLSTTPRTLKLLRHSTKRTLGTTKRTLATTKRTLGTRMSRCRSAQVHRCDVPLSMAMAILLSRSRLSHADSIKRARTFDVTDAAVIAAIL